MDETSSAEGAATASSSLPEDVVREIFVRVEDPAALFRCAMTSKRWIRLVADSSFIRRRWPGHGASGRMSSRFLVGFATRKQVDHRRRLATSFIPTSRSFGTARRRLGSLFPNAVSPLDHAVPLASRRGLLLVRLALPRLAVVHLAVCDMIAGACHVLPPLIHSSEVPKSGYAILTDADCCSSTERQLASPLGYSTFYKVVVLGVKWSSRPENLHTFSSSEARWSTPQTLLFDSSQIVLRGLPRHHDGVVCRGTVHWLVGDWSNAGSTNLYTLGVDLETCRLSWTKVPDTLNYCSSLSYDEPQLKVATDGTLSLLVLHRPSLQLQIYTRHNSKIIEDTASDGWICTHVVELKPPKQIQRRPLHLSILGVKGDMILLKDNKGHVYVGDLETGAIDKMDVFGWLNRRSVVLLEMDWPTYFISRLDIASKCLHVK